LQGIYRARNQPQPEESAKNKAKVLIHDIDTNDDGRLSVTEFVTGSIKCPSIRALLQGMPE